MKIGAALLGTGAVALAYFLWPRTSVRQRIVEIAEGEVGPQNPQKYWEDVIPGAAGTTFSGDWCGGFSLWVLHQAGLGLDVSWVIGEGYLYNLATTNDPQPGDIAYMNLPYQHHAVVVDVSGGIATTVDGNQPGNTVQIKTRPASAWTAFYSVQPWIDEAGA